MSSEVKRVINALGRGLGGSRSLVVISSRGRSAPGPLGLLGLVRQPYTYLIPMVSDLCMTSDEPLSLSGPQFPQSISRVPPAFVFAFSGACSLSPPFRALILPGPAQGGACPWLHCRRVNVTLACLPVGQIGRSWERSESRGRAFQGLER